MKNTILSKFICTLLGLYVVLGQAAAVFARRPDPNAIPDLEPAVPWRGVIYSLIGLLCICLVAFKTTKRTHLE